jgi:hypothetical protein
MNVNAWHTEFGLALVDPKSLQPPAPPRIPKPVFENVFLSGTVSNATDSTLELTAISISPHVPRGVRLLAGRELSVQYGPDHSELGALKAGSRLSLAVTITGFPDTAYRDTEHGTRGVVEKVFWTAPP